MESNLIPPLISPPSILHGVSLDVLIRTDRPWWLSGLERVPYSSRHSLEDPGSNPTRGYDINRPESEMMFYIVSYTFKVK